MPVLEFYLTGDKGEKRPPEWKEIEAANAQCPNCRQTMVVILGHQAFLYAFCLKCKRYYKGE